MRAGRQEKIRSSSSFQAQTLPGPLIIASFFLHSCGKTVLSDNILDFFILRQHIRRAEDWNLLHLFDEILFLFSNTEYCICFLLTSFLANPRRLS